MSAREEWVRGPAPTRAEAIAAAKAAVRKARAERLAKDGKLDEETADPAEEEQP